MASAMVIRQGVSTDNGTVWYDYDGDNRVTVSAGQLKDGTIVVAGTDTSYALGYDADGNAATRLTMDRYGTLRIQQSVYDGRHQLVRADYAKVVGGTDQGVAETRTYDAAGHVVTDNQYYALGTTANKRYNAKTDPDSLYYIGNGQIVSRRDGTASGDTIDKGAGTAAAQRSNHFVYVNGQQVGHYDNDKALDVLSHVTAFSSGNSTGDYVVQEGDTLKSIAQAVYGNASLWYVIAQANALGGDNELATGSTIWTPSNIRMPTRTGGSDMGSCAARAGRVSIKAMSEDS